MVLFKRPKLHPTMTKLQMTLQHEKTVCGVPGVQGSIYAWEEKISLFAAQEWTSEARAIEGYGKHAKMRVGLSFQDNPRNGHNTFYITGKVTTPASIRRNDCEAFGMMTDEIKAVFPELSHLIKWHGVSTDGPSHYLSNVVWLAGDRDCWGLKQGEPLRYAYAVRFGDNPIKHNLRDRDFANFLETCASSGFDMEIIEYHHDFPEKFNPKFTFGGYANYWHECPFDTFQQAEDFLVALQKCSPVFLKTPASFSRGKPRELDAARQVAIWPDATDAELTAEPEQLKKALVDRLPELLRSFRKDITDAGLIWL